MNHTSHRDAYQAPALVCVGSLERVTMGKQDGSKLDASFPVNTPKPALTFS